jgi:hypothetical protein
VTRNATLHVSFVSLGPAGTTTTLALGLGLLSDWISVTLIVMLYFRHSHVLICQIHWPKILASVVVVPAGPRDNMQ